MKKTITLLAALVGIALLATAAIVFMNARYIARQLGCESRLAQLSAAIRLHAQHNGGILPVALPDLAMELSGDPIFFVCPCANPVKGNFNRAEEWSTYRYFPGSTKSNDISRILLLCTSDAHRSGQQPVLLLDGRVCTITELNEANKAKDDTAD